MLSRRTLPLREVCTALILYKDLLVYLYSARLETWCVYSPDCGRCATTFIFLQITDLGAYVSVLISTIQQVVHINTYAVW